jgi:UDP-2,3-diacylglucosamine pyrophosphatase LpxH
MAQRNIAPGRDANRRTLAARLAGTGVSEHPATHPGQSGDHLRFRSVWISDLHLGTTDCRAGELLDFLRLVRSEYLYLVGNVIDGLRLRRRWHWPQAHNDVVQKILRLARKGTKVVFIPGRHDEFGRNFVRMSFGGIDIRSDALHVTADGRRLFVARGDLYDHPAQRARLLRAVEGRMDELFRRLGRWGGALNDFVRVAGGTPSAYRELQSSQAAARLMEFEHGMAAEARRRGVDGVVCGYTRRPGIRDIDGTLYCNDGDWVESLTALVETEAGELRLLRWRDVASTEPAAPPRPVDARQERMLAHTHSK